MIDTVRPARATRSIDKVCRVLDIYRIIPFIFPVFNFNAVCIALTVVLMLFKHAKCPSNVDVPTEVHNRTETKSRMHLPAFVGMCVSLYYLPVQKPTYEEAMVNLFSSMLFTSRLSMLLLQFLFYCCWFFSLVLSSFAPSYPFLSLSKRISVCLRGGFCFIQIETYIFLHIFHNLPYQANKPEPYTHTTHTKCAHIK